AGALALALCVAGAALAARRAALRPALAGAVVGIGGAELFFAAAHHWSSGRYDALGWIFLPTLMALPLAALAGRRREHRWATALLLVLGAALLVGEAAGLARYARAGRPDWQRVAAVVRAARRPGEPVLVENETARISLGYYLQGPLGVSHPEADEAPRVI